MAEQYVVKGLAAVVNVKGGFAQLLQRGAVLPANVDPDHLQHLLDNDLVEEGEPAGLETVYTGDLQPIQPAKSNSSDDDVDGDGPIPAKSATKDVWVAYAVTQGATQEDADASTKDDLIAAYGNA